jgi:hypothetical protein
MRYSPIRLESSSNGIARRSSSAASRNTFMPYSPCPGTTPLKKIVEEIKKGSSKWMKADGPRNSDFHWQNGYAAFSVSESNVLDVQRYIENQQEHHRKRTFQEELRTLLTRHGVEFDERYVWD